MSVDHHLGALLGGVEAWNNFHARATGTSSYDFSGADLTDLGPLNRFQFEKPTNFDGASFRDLIVQGSKFSRQPDFRKIVVEGDSEIIADGNNLSLIFNEAEFFGKVEIRCVGHGCALEFQKAKFHGPLILVGTFGGTVDFSDSEVMSYLQAAGVTFVNLARFCRLRHEPKESGLQVSFVGSQFKSIAEFEGFRTAETAEFSNAMFGRRTNFLHAVFERAPSFHGAELHQETQFNPAEQFDRQFPDVSTDEAEARYRTLKFHMIGQHALAEQLGFGRLELKARARRKGRLWWMSVFGLYEALSDWGLSFVRPVFWLTCALTIEWATLWFLSLPQIKWSDPRLVSVAIGNIVPYLTSLRLFGPAQMADIFSAESVLKVELVSVIFSMFSTVMLFLVALGVRNRLRLK